jgi:signal transduction histidine kinase
MIGGLKARFLIWAGKGSFTRRVFRIFLVFTLSMAVVLTLLFVHYQTERVRHDLMVKGKTIATLLANSSRVGVFAENRELLDDAAEGVMSQKEVRSVMIYSLDGTELLKKDKLAAENGHTGRKAIEFTEPIILDQTQTSEDVLFFGAQAGNRQKNIIGYVKVSLDSSMVSEDVRSIVAQNFAVAFLFLLVGSMFLAFALKRALRPLSQLTEEVKMLGQGGQIESISVATDDEIGRLASAFNTMAENLKQTERETRALETRLRYAQKMEAVGTLARGIAHDFNNILTTVQASLYIMHKKIDAENILFNHVVRMNNSISKAKMLIQSLLTFSRGQAVRLVPVDISAIVEKMQPMIKGLVGDNIESVFVIPDRPLVIMADQVQLEQVLMNLASNARDAMTEGGTLTITLGEAEGVPGYYTSNPGRYAMIVVTDTGSGIPDEIKERIFEPFFTTKEVGKGTGLGLSIVYGIIEQKQGHINVGSGPQGGAEFRIYLPLYEKSEKTDQDIEAGG